MEDLTDSVLASIRELIAKKKSSRELVEVLRKLTWYSAPAAGPALDALLAVLQQLRTNKQTGEENKAIRAAYQCIAATIASHPFEAVQGTIVMHQLRGIDLKDDLLPRKLAALLLYADIAVRFPLVEAAIAFPSAVLRPMLVAAATAVQDASTPGKVASLSGKHRKTHDLDCFAAPAVFAALCSIAGAPLLDAAHLLPYLAPALSCNDADISRIASAALAKAAVRIASAAPSYSSAGTISPTRPPDSPERDLLLAVISSCAPEQWQSPRVAQASLSAGGDQTSTSSFWGRKASSLPIGAPPTALNTADAAATRSYLRAAASLSGVCISSEHASAINAAQPCDAPPVMYAAHIASGVAGSGGATSRVIAAFEGASLAVREGLDEATLRMRSQRGSLDWPRNLLIPLPPPPASTLLLDPALSRDPGSPSAAHADAYSTLLAALDDPRPTLRLEAARLLACGGLPRLLTHAKGVVTRPSRGVLLLPTTDGVARVRSVTTAIRLALHSSVVEGSVPLMCTALRAAIAFGVALSAFEGQAVLQLRRAVCRVAGLAVPGVHAPGLAPDAAAGIAALQGGFQVMGSCAMAACLLINAVCRVILLADGGADGPARGVLAHPCSLALKALLWCCPAFVLSVPAAQQINRFSADTCLTSTDELLTTWLGVSPDAAPRTGTAWQAVRGALVGAVTDEHLRMMRDTRRVCLVALQDIPQRVQCGDMREWLRCLGDRAVAYTRVHGPVVSLVAALPLLWFRQRCGRYGAGIEGAGDSPSCSALPGSAASPNWSGVPPAAWPWASGEASAEGVTTSALRRGIPAEAVRDHSAPLGLFLRLLAGPDPATVRGPLLLLRSGRTPSMALETMLASWEVLRWLSQPAPAKAHLGGGDILSKPTAATAATTASQAATSDDIFGITALGSILTVPSIVGARAYATSEPVSGIRLRQPGDGQLLTATLLLVSDPVPFSSTHAVYAAGRAAAALHAQLTGLIAASDASAYFLSSPKLKRCVQGIATARRAPDLAGASLLGWPLIGGLQPGAAVSATADLVETRARSLAAFYLKTYALPVKASPDGRLWSGISGGLLLRLSSLHCGEAAAAAKSPFDTPPSLLLPLQGPQLGPLSHWRFPLAPHKMHANPFTALLDGICEGAARGADVDMHRCDRRSTFEEKLSGLEEEAEARSRLAWARTVVVASALPTTASLSRRGE